MLTLGLEIGDVVWVMLPDGRRVKVQYVEPKCGGSVRLGFEADRDIGFVRDAVLRRDERRDRSAVGA
jgi:hypothetical protein